MTARQPTAGKAREVLLDFLHENERHLRSEASVEMLSLEFNLALEATQALLNIFSPRNEALAGQSAAELIWRSLRAVREGKRQVSEAFWQEIYHLFLAALAQTTIYKGLKPPAFLSMTGRAAGRERSRELDRVGQQIEAWVNRYPTGLSGEAVDRRDENRARILRFFKAHMSDWQNWRWHLAHLIRDADTLGNLIRLTAAERKAIELARQRGLPFGVTPYYVSLMDRQPGRRRDHAVRAQVIPPKDYVERVSEIRATCPQMLDFMAERDTSPMPLIVRRYPQIAIFKPFNTCAQICVYCQRNWEVRDAMSPGAMASRDDIQRALAWFRRHRALREVLVTGGDPLLMPDETIEWLLRELNRMEHIIRIRIGTRLPVVLPMRFTRRLLDIFAKYHHQEWCTIAITTHFEHPYEVTPDVRAALEGIRQIGISVYNQQVFTVENSRKFETVALRYALKEVWIDPYYNFNTKGKEETRSYRVPIARILQERKEEARLTPGTDRTDEPVFNLPRLGKNYLRAGQDHSVIAIRPNGSRVYEFLPWEKNLVPTPTYIYDDVPIWDYLQEMVRRGEKIEDYENIWYHF
ncbi:KamA family radical SAM protein [Candidatus Sumerlaeota bacterium]|nr:KamA family radical SAM protein [Candidatus Sumerlaeota bacterium]